MPTATLDSPAEAVEKSRTGKIRLIVDIRKGFSESFFLNDYEISQCYKTLNSHKYPSTGTPFLLVTLAQRQAYEASLSKDIPMFVEEALLEYPLFLGCPLVCVDDLPRVLKALNGINDAHCHT